MANYPDHLPFFSTRNGYSTGAPGGIQRTGTDAGPAKMRRRSSGVPRPDSGTTAPMTVSQLAAFEDWVRDSIAGGAISFTALHPVQQVVRRFRFTDPKRPYSVAPAGRGFAVSAELEILS